jgi:hypothetical protein
MLKRYLQETFGIDALYVPLVGRAPWGVSIELSDWSGECDEWRSATRAVEHAEKVLKCIQSPGDEMLLVAYHDGDFDEPGPGDLAPLLRNPDLLASMSCDVVETRPDEFHEPSYVSWADVNYLCVLEGRARDFDFASYLRGHIPGYDGDAPRLDGQYFWVNKSRSSIWCIGNRDLMEIVTAEPGTLKEVRRRYKLERIQP